MPKYSLMVARFPYGGTEEQETVDWLMKTAVELDRDPRFEVVNFRIADTPITMTRNRVFQRAMDLNIDYLLLIDSDMAPDVEVGHDPAAKPFLKTALDFALAHEGPCVVAAPYCGPPPMENVYVFQWRKWAGELDTPDFSIEQYTREQAAVMSGVQEAAALPTGLMLIDVRALRKLPQPHTYYEFAGDGPKCQACGIAEPGPQHDKISTEDVTFTRDLSLMGVPVYCTWDSWAGHVKRHVGRKPRFWTADSIAKKMHKAIVTGHNDGDRMVDVRPPAWLKDKLVAAEAADKKAVETPQDVSLTAVPPRDHAPPQVNPNPAVGDGILRRMMEDEAARVRSHLPFPMNGFSASTVAATVSTEPRGIHAQSGIVGHLGYTELPPNAGAMTAEELFSYDPVNPMFPPLPTTPAA